MRHNDYKIISYCPKCSKPVFKCVSMAKAASKNYPTCQHVAANK